MQNVHAKWRTDYARQLAGRIAAFEGVQAIVIAGSVACNYADEYSDLEIPVFWESLPDDGIRHALAGALNGDFVFAYDGPSREDQLLIGGLQVDLWHIAVAHQEATIEAVLREHRADLGSLNAMDTIRRCVPLHGEAIVQGWKQRAEDFPDDLAAAILREHLESFRVDQLALFAHRDDPTNFYAQLAHLHREAFVVLLALNRSYFPTFKWLFPSLGEMRVKPEAVGDRFRRAFSEKQTETVADTRQILREILDLVDEHLAWFDTAPYRRRLSYARRPHTPPTGL